MANDNPLMGHDKAFLTKVLTPAGELYNGPATALDLPATDGRMRVLRNHAPIVAVLGNGQLKLESPNGGKTYGIEGGLLEVRRDAIYVLVDRLTDDAQQG